MRTSPSFPPLAAAFTCALIASGAPLQASPQDQTPPGATSRALARALDRMHKELTKDLDIWSDHSTFEKAWVGSTKNFRVLTTESYGTAKDIADGLETMLGHFQKVLGTDYVPKKPLPVFIYPDRAQYNAFGETHGENHSSFYGSFHATGHPEQPVAVEWNDNPVLLRMQITHSVVHQYLHEAFPASRGRRTAWLEEGLAAYFTHYWDPAWTLSEYQRNKADGRLIDLERALIDPIGSYGSDTDSRMLQLAVFFDYLLRLREDTKTIENEDGTSTGMFRDYLVGTLNGKMPMTLKFSSVLINRKKLAADFSDYEFAK